MKKNNIASQLLNGSAEIDRMRREIHALVSLVVGYVRETYTVAAREADYQSITKSLGDGTWNINGRIVTDGDTQFTFHVTCFIPEFGPGTAYQYSEFEKKSHTIPARLVKAVHETLEKFVEGILEKFPAVATAWKPLIEAAAE